MSTTRAVAAPVLTRPMGYVSLAKPDVSFLVVMTTLAGYLLGSVGYIDWARLAHTVIGTTLVAAGTSALNHYLERETDARMRRTASRPLPSGVLKSTEAVGFGIALVSAGIIELLVTTNALASLLAIATSVTYLGVYTPLKTRTIICHVYRRISRRRAAADWLGCRARIARAWRLGALRDFIFVAISAFSRHRLDVPRGLRPGRHSDASRRRHRRAFHFCADRVLRGRTGAGQPAGFGHGDRRRPFLFWRPGRGTYAGGGLLVGSRPQDERTCQVADACDRAASADITGFDDPG